MKKNTTISVMVPAYNEEKYISKVIIETYKALSRLFKDFEILVFDDCSTDKTPEIVDKIAKKYPKLKVIHNKVNMGLGYNYRQGIKLAKKEFFAYIPGDISEELDVVKKVLKQVGEADLIIPYISNQNDRTFFRRFVSKSYGIMLNILFNLRINYYNGYLITKTKELKALKLKSNSFATQSEIIVKLLKKKKSYIQVPYKTVPRDETSVFKIKNIFGVLTTIIKLFFNVNILRRYN